MSDVSRPMSESYFYLSRDDTTDAVSLSPASATSDTTALMRLAGNFDKFKEATTQTRSPNRHFSAHSTPLTHKPETQSGRTSMGNISAKADGKTDLEARLRPLLRQELDGFQAKIEEMIRKQTSHKTDNQPGALSTPIRGASIELGHNGLPRALLKFDASGPESPVTTPPHSHEYDTKNTPAGHSMGHNSLGFNVTSPSPAMPPVPHTPLSEPSSETEQLRAEIARLQAENHMLQARNVDLTLHVNDLEFQLQHQDTMDLTSSRIDIPTDAATRSVAKPMTIDLVPAEFRRHYHKLRLDDLDTIDGTELRNTLKSIMLSLLICDYQTLPEMSLRIAQYIRITGEFMDKIHRELYVIEGNLRPSRYLRIETPQAHVRFQECLDQMAEQIAALGRSGKA